MAILDQQTSAEYRVSHGRFSRGESSQRCDFFRTPNYERRSHDFAASRETRTLGPVVVYLCVRLFRAVGTDVCAYTGCAGPTECLLAAAACSNGRSSLSEAMIASISLPIFDRIIN